MSGIVAALRVKNEERWIERVLRSVEWCDEIFLFDDDSDDSTAEIADDCGATVIPTPFDDFNEARDKEHLVSEIAESYNPQTWILMIDGDEVLEARGEWKIRHCISSNYGMPAFRLRILYLWNSEKTIRMDGVYGKFFRPSLFRLGTDHRFLISGATGNLHCSNIPACYFNKTGNCEARILHLGYMLKEDRIRKWKYYNSLDPRNRGEGYDPAHPERGSYPHIIQGDVLEIPPEIKLKHGGPLELRKL